jgi:hypothetical protein
MENFLCYSAAIISIYAVLKNPMLFCRGAGENRMQAIQAIQSIGDLLVNKYIKQSKIKS